MKNYYSYKTKCYPLLINNGKHCQKNCNLSKTCYHFYSDSTKPSQLVLSRKKRPSSSLRDYEARFNSR